MNAPDKAELPVKSLSRSLKQRVLLLSLIGAAGLGSTIILIMFLTLNGVQNRLDRINAEAVGLFDRFFMDIQSELQTISHGLAARKDKDSALLTLRMRNKAFLDVFFINQKGIILAERSAAGRIRQKKIVRPFWLESQLPFGRVAAGPVLFEGINPYVDMAITATDGIGLPAGFLLVRVDLTELWNTALDIKVGKNGYAYIADSTGQLVAFRNRHLLETGSNLEKLIKRSPQAIALARLSFYTGLAGHMVLASAQQLNSVPWFAVVEQPVFEALAPFIIAMPFLLAAMVIVSLLLFNTIHFTHIRIVIPLLALRDKVGQIAEGEILQKIEIRHNDELGQLAGSFNRMSGQLRQAFIDLENRIDALQKTQEALHESEKQYRSLIESANEAVVVIQNALVVFANKKAMEMINLDEKALLSRPFIDFIYPDDRAMVLDYYNRRLNKESVPENYELRVMRDPNNVLLIEIKIALINWEGKPASLNLMTDITERKRAEEALRESETKFRAMFENSRDAINVSRNGVQVFANPAFLKLYGYERIEEYAGKSILDHIAPSHHQQIKDYLERRAAGKEVPSFYETRGLKNDGTTFDEEVKVSTYELNGEMYSVAIIRDITERKQAEEALLDTKERYLTLFENANDSIFMMNEKEFLECNIKAVELFGCADKSEIIGRSPADFSPAFQPDGRPSGEKSVEFIRTALEENPQFFYWQHKRKDQVLIDTEVSLNSLSLNGKTYLQAIVRDITERKRAEEELNKRMDELTAWYKVTIGREGRVMELKEEVNKLLEKLGRPPRYKKPVPLNGDQNTAAGNLSK